MEIPEELLNESDNAFNLYLEDNNLIAIPYDVIKKYFESIPMQLPVKPACDIDISNIKWGQNTIKIYGHEWYDNGIWKIEIFNPFDNLEFEYKIMDNDTDKDYTLWDFIEEAMIKYNESRKSV